MLASSTSASTSISTPHSQPSDDPMDPDGIIEGATTHTHADESPSAKLDRLDESHYRSSSSNGDLSAESYFSYETSSSYAQSQQGQQGNLHHMNMMHLTRHPSIGTSSNNSWTSSSGSLKRSSTRNVFSDAEMNHAQEQPLTLTKYFGHDVNQYTHGDPNAPTFDKHLRRFIEPHIAKARKSREDRRCLVFDKLGIEPRVVQSLSISSNAYIPYPALRNERPFLFDTETYPLHTILAQTLGVEDLSLLHEHSIKDKKLLMSPLLDAKKRRAFHQHYDNFVVTFCIPLLHSLAMVQNLLNDFSREPGSRRICYRYQAFPCLRIIRPGEFSIGPHCDMAYGHSMGNINFHIPLTPTFGTNCLFTESHPGREDWHPLKTKSVGLGFAFDGARCLHFTLENTTPRTRVSLDFRIAIYRDRSTSSVPVGLGSALLNSSQKLFDSSNALMTSKEQKEGKEDEEECDVHDSLCNQILLKDNYTTFPGYYDEAYVDIGAKSSGLDGMQQTAVQKKDKLLMVPDKRVGFPF